MICEKCGKQIPENLSYCPTCKINNDFVIALENKPVKNSRKLSDKYYLKEKNSLVDEKDNAKSEESLKSEQRFYNIIIFISVLLLVYFFGSVVTFLLASTLSSSDFCSGTWFGGTVFCDKSSNLFPILIFAVSIFSLIFSTNKKQNIKTEIKKLCKSDIQTVDGELNLLTEKKYFKKKRNTKKLILVTIVLIIMICTIILYFTDFFSIERKDLINSTTSTTKTTTTINKNNQENEENYDKVVQIMGYSMDFVCMPNSNIDYKLLLKNNTLFTSENGVIDYVYKAINDFIYINEPGTCLPGKVLVITSTNILLETTINESGIDKDWIVKLNNVSKFISVQDGGIILLLENNEEKFLDLFEENSYEE